MVRGPTSIALTVLTASIGAGLALSLASWGCSPTTGGAGPSAGAPDGSLVFVDSGDTDPLDAIDAAIGARARALFASPRCSGGAEQKCHGDGAGGLWLHFGDSADGLGGTGADVIGIPSMERPTMWRVRPFDPDRSYMMLKVAGDAGIDGDVMPVGNGPDPRIVALVHAWIEAGAPAR